MRSEFQKFSARVVLAHVGIIVLLSAAGLHVHHDGGTQIKAAGIAHPGSTCDAAADTEAPVQHLLEIFGATVPAGVFRTLDLARISPPELTGPSGVALPVGPSAHFEVPYDFALIPSSVPDIAWSAKTTLLSASRAPPLCTV